jgi:hypothetical protein
MNNSELKCKNHSLCYASELCICRALELRHPLLPTAFLKLRHLAPICPRRTVCAFLARESSSCTNKGHINTKTLLLSSQFIHMACLNNLRRQAHRTYNWRIIRIGLWLAVLCPPPPLPPNDFILLTVRSTVIASCEIWKCRLCSGWKNWGSALALWGYGL